MYIYTKANICRCLICLKEIFIRIGPAYFPEMSQAMTLAVHISSTNTIATERGFPPLHIQNGRRYDKTRYRVGINCSKGVWKGMRTKILTFYNWQNLQENIQLPSYQHHTPRTVTRYSRINILNVTIIKRENSSKVRVLNAPLSNFLQYLPLFNYKTASL
jgi:hypothetical protein